MIKVCNDLGELLERPRLIFEDFIDDLVEADLPFKVFETYRPQERQDYLYARGRTTKGPRVTNAKHSRHTQRRAADFILDLEHAYWGATPWQGSPWTTGTRRGEVTDRRVLSAWLLFGAIADSSGLIWGGRWKRRSTDLMGWDPYHTEVPL